MRGESYEFVACRICGCNRRELINHILHTHEITVDEYHRRFPGAPIRSQATRDKRSKALTGIPHPWCAGDNNVMRRDPVVKKRVIDSHIGVPRPDITGDKSPTKRPEVRKKISEATKGKSKPSIQGDKNWTRRRPDLVALYALQRVGVTFSEERVRAISRGVQGYCDNHREEMCDSAAHMRSFCSSDNTKQERTLQEILDELKVVWKKTSVKVLREQAEYHRFDAVVKEYKGVQVEICFEADGCYWHQCSEHCPDAAEKDARVALNIERDGVVGGLCDRLGVPLYRFWEHDLLEKRAVVKSLIQEILEKVCSGEATNVLVGERVNG